MTEYALLLCGLGSVILGASLVWCFLAEHVVDYLCIALLALIGGLVLFAGTGVDKAEMPSPYENPEMCLDAGGDLVYTPSGFYSGCVLSEGPN